MNNQPENIATSLLDSLLGFNGERIDPVLHSYHLGNGYRMYSPTLRRFTAPDDMSPFGAGGINPYAYCEGDPINHTDPTGHMPGRKRNAFGVLLSEEKDDLLDLMSQEAKLVELTADEVDCDLPHSGQHAGTSAEHQKHGHIGKTLAEAVPIHQVDIGVAGSSQMLYDIGRAHSMLYDDVAPSDHSFYAYGSQVAGDADPANFMRRRDLLKWVRDDVGNFYQEISHVVIVNQNSNSIRLVAPFDYKGAIPWLDLLSQHNFIPGGYINNGTKWQWYQTNLSELSIDHVTYLLDTVGDRRYIPHVMLRRRMDPA